MELIRAIKAETFKVYKSKMFILAILAPFVMALLAFLQLLLMPIIEGYNPWQETYTGSALIWVYAFIPLFVGVGSAMISNIETSSNTWKQLYSTPISRSSIYLSKLLVGIFFVGFSTALLFLMTTGVAFIMRFIRPELGFNHFSPGYSAIIKALSLMYLGTFLIIAMGVWLSTRVKSFILPAGLGIVGLISNIFLFNSIKYAKFSPWMNPVNILRASHPSFQSVSTNFGFSTNTYLAISLIGALIITVLGLLDLKRRDIL